MILYINSCIRSDSRTNKIAKALLNKLGEYKEINLSKLDIKPLSEEVLNKRTNLIEKGDFSDPLFDLAKEFSLANKIVISSPFYDLSFPSILKVYLENIYITDIVSKYGKDGRPIGLCSATDLYFVTTSGGPLFLEYGFNYIKELATNYFGIRNVHLIKAENLDIIGNNPSVIVNDCINNL